MNPLRLNVMGTAFILVWSSGYLVGSIATQESAPLALTMWRFAIAAAVLGVIALVRREVWPRGRQLVAMLGIGVPMFAVQFGALYTAMSDGLSAGTTALIACSSPLVVAAIGAVSGWEGLRPGQWLGIGLGVVGVAVTLADRVGRPPNVATLLWALLGLAGLALGTTLQGRVRTGAGPSAVAAVQVAAGCAVLAVWAPLKGETGLSTTPTGIVSFAWLALVAGVGAPLLLNALVRRSGATRASSHLFVVPAVTAVAAWPLLGTPLGPLTVLGLVIVVVALSLATGRIGGPRRAQLTRVVTAYAAPNVAANTSTQSSASSTEGRHGRDDEQVAARPGRPAPAYERVEQQGRTDAGDQSEPGERHDAGRCRGESGLALEGRPHREHRAPRGHLDRRDGGRPGAGLHPALERGADRQPRQAEQRPQQGRDARRTPHPVGEGHHDTDHAQGDPQPLPGAQPFPAGRCGDDRHDQG